MRTEDRLDVPPVPERAIITTITSTGHEFFRGHRRAEPTKPTPGQSRGLRCHDETLVEGVDALPIEMHSMFACAGPGKSVNPLRLQATLAWQFRPRRSSSHPVSRGMDGALESTGSCPRQHPVLRPSAAARRTLQSLHAQHVTAAIVSNAVADRLSIERDSARLALNTQDSDVSQAIRILVGTARRSEQAAVAGCEVNEECR